MELVIHRDLFSKHAANNSREFPSTSKKSFKQKIIKDDETQVVQCSFRPLQDTGNM